MEKTVSKTILIGNLSYKIEIEEDSNSIIKYMQTGTSLPILPEFVEFVLRDLKTYNAKALLLVNQELESFGMKTDNVEGFALVYEDGSDTLFFGFFRTCDHDQYKIEILLDAMIQYAKKNNFQKLRGPINVPTMIFGWGFMVPGSRKDLFIGSPINPPIYQETFYKYGFNLLFQEDRYDMPALKMNPHKDKKLISLGINEGNYKNDPFDTGEYPYEFINYSKEEMIEHIEEYSSLYQKYMPPSAQITPKTTHNVRNLIDFIFKNGAQWMMWIVRHKETGEMIANGYVIPDVFHKNKKGELDSISFHAWVVHPDHRRMYLAMLMYGLTSIQGKDRKTPHYITRGSWPVGAENVANGNAAVKMGGKKDRSHLILQLKL